MTFINYKSIHWLNIISSVILILYQFCTNSISSNSDIIFILTLLGVSIMQYIFDIAMFVFETHNKWRFILYDFIIIFAIYLKLFTSQNTLLDLFVFQMIIIFQICKLWYGLLNMTRITRLFIIFVTAPYFFIIFSFTQTTFFSRIVVIVSYLIQLLFGFILHSIIYQYEQRIINNQVFCYHLQEENKELQTQTKNTQKINEKIISQKNNLQKVNAEISKKEEQNKIIQIIMEKSITSKTLKSFIENLSTYFIKHYKQISCVYFSVCVDDKKHQYCSSPGKIEEYHQYVKKRRRYIRQNECNYFEKHANYYRYLLLLKNKTNDIGVIVFELDEHNAIFDDIDFINQLEEQIILSITKLSSSENLKKLANKDGLTKTYNRRYIESSLKENFIKKTREENTCFCVAMFDIDHFKNVNDTYGHTIGDEALKTVAQILQEECKKINGVVGRYGGEEFLIYALTKKELFTYQLENILEKIRTTPILSSDNTPFNITISCGASIEGDCTLTIDNLISITDTSLYAAKKTGRDKIVYTN